MDRPIKPTITCDGLTEVPDTTEPRTSFVPKAIALWDSLKRILPNCNAIMSYFDVSTTYIDESVKQMEALSTATIAASNYKGEYQSGYNYSSGDVVSKTINSEAVMFYSLSDSNTTEPPSSNWAQISCCNSTKFITTPVISVDGFPANEVELTVNVTAETLLNNTSIDRYEIDFGDGNSATTTTGTITHTYSGNAGDVFTIKAVAIDNLSNSSQVGFTNVQLLEKGINTPTDITVEVDEDGVIDNKNPDVTLNSLPDVVGTGSAIDKVYFRVIKVSDDSEVGITQETTGITLPITFTSPDLDVSTTYRFEFRCEITSENLQSEWGYIQVTSKYTFLPVFDIFKDGSRVFLNLFKTDYTDIGGIYNLTPVGDISLIETGVTCTSPDTSPSSDYINLYIDAFNNNDIFTINLNVMIKNSSSYSQHIISNYACSSSQVLFWVTFSDDAITIAYMNRAISSYGYTTIENIEYNRWYFISAVINKIDHKITAYKDGEVIGSIVDSSIASSLAYTPRLFGWTANCSSVNAITADAIINNLSLFNRELTAEEIHELYTKEGMII